MTGVQTCALPISVNNEIDAENHLLDCPPNERVTLYNVEYTKGLRIESSMTFLGSSDKKKQKQNKNKTGRIATVMNMLTAQIMEIKSERNTPRKKKKKVNK